MFKKIIGSLAVASALSIGFGSTDSEASQWNHSSATFEQTHSGWERMLEWQQEKMNDHQSELHGSAGTMQGQSLFVKGVQLQSGHSNGPATASQSGEIMIDMGDEAIKQKQSTEGFVSIVQTTSAPSSAHLLQSQSNTTAVFHFQGAIEGGPAIQNQISQIHSYQFSTAVAE